MHPGLQALAEDSSPPGAATFKVVLAQIKRFVNVETMSLHLSKMRVLARTFFSPRAFSKPQTRTEWIGRLQMNAKHYWNIYMTLFLVVLVYTVLSSPWFLMGIALICGSWAYAFVLTSPDTALEVAGFELRRREKLLVLVPFSLLVVALCGMINSIIYVGFLTGFLALPHASFHEPAEFDALDALELEGLQEGQGLQAPV